MAARSPSHTVPAHTVDWKQVLKETWDKAGADNLSLTAAGVAFYAFSAMVPLLTAFVLSYGLVADPASVVRHVQMLTDVMPQQSASIIGDQLESMSASADGKTGFALLLALAIALYGASKGAGAVMTGLNVAYGASESRSFVRRTTLAIGLVAGAVAVMLLAILAMSVMASLEQWLPALGGFGAIIAKASSLTVAAAIVALFIALLYRHAPNRPDAAWRWITPGSLIATVVWLVATTGFGVYVANFGNYNATYGSLGAVIVFLTWLYLSAYIILLGAQLNGVLEQRDAAASEQPAAA